MERHVINPPELAPPRGFNHGFLCRGGRILFLAGQDASDGKGQIVSPGDLVAQYEQVLRNLQAVVVAAGGQMTDIVKMNIFVSDGALYRQNLPALGRVHRRYFGRHYPATALFEVSGFFQPENMVEIEGIAHLPDELPPAAPPPGG